jgi:hypothetical protein
MSNFVRSSPIRSETEQIRFVDDERWYPGFVTCTIMDAHNNSVTLTDTHVSVLFAKMTGDLDPRVSSCVYCRSCVVATDPLIKVLDVLNVELSSDSDFVDEISELVENADTVHLYILEDNDCVHNLWRDPLASEWSDVTGEKRV